MKLYFGQLLRLLRNATISVQYFAGCNEAALKTHPALRQQALSFGEGCTEESGKRETGTVASGGCACEQVSRTS